MKESEIEKAKRQLQRMGIEVPPQKRSDYVPKSPPANTEWNRLTNRTRVLPQIEQFTHSPKRNPRDAFRVIIDRNGKRFLSEIFFNIEDAIACREEMLKQLPKPKARFIENMTW